MKMHQLAGVILTAYVLLAWPSDVAWSRENQSVPHRSAATDVAVGAPLRIDVTRIAVAGISSGAYMAVQAQIAYPELFRRAGILAGGPYQCAEGSLQNMIQRCMDVGAPSSEDVARFVATTVQRSKDGSIGPLSALSTGIVYLLHGTADTVVLPSVAATAMTYYTGLKKAASLTGLSITDDNQREFGHTFPTDLSIANMPVSGGTPNREEDCKLPISPYFGHCGFDAAKAILTHLYPEIDASHATQAIPLEAERVSFLKAKNAYLEDWAYLYVPDACHDGQPCGLLVALHGCNQNYSAIKDTFVRLSGFNRWADAFRVAVLYPQTQTFDGNYGGCWDWWGYTGADYDTRSGPQMQWLAHAVNVLVKQQASR